ncbi:non-canonical purine NTP pyrophosphatase [Candidatus Cardinium hertigii]|uniref:non-canonical purine NTP pyrophosphatase n=1 Tax=Candidatus Cardinium hertigii TaxID=247481 RepID=UPI00160B1ECC|nr:non-canonical purine NTP pyrophosphatase [Candidatus Cardinium hertigii]
MKEINFVTSNALKLKEVRAILGNNSFCNFKLLHYSLELPELQASPTEIAINKCMTAANVVQGPALIDDTMLTFNSLNGLPGPYIKAFIAQIGLEGLVRILTDFQDKSAQVSCTFGYTEGPNHKVHLFTGTINGKIVAPSPYLDTSQSSWGSIFQPDGYHINYAMMDQDEKNKISHRYKALMLLKEYFMKQANERLD